MNIYTSCFVLVALSCAVEAKYDRDPPKVQLYSSEPGEYGLPNFLICHVSEFHPPDITIQLLHAATELPAASQTDLAFKKNWHFHLIHSAPFTPTAGQKFLCRVDHGGKITDYEWEPNM